LILFLLVCALPALFSAQELTPLIAMLSGSIALMLFFLFTHRKTSNWNKLKIGLVLLLLLSLLPVVFSPVPKDGLLHWLAIPFLISAWLFWSKCFGNAEAAAWQALGFKTAVLFIILFGWIAMLPLLKDLTISHAETYFVTLGFGHRNLLAQWVVMTIPLLLVFNGTANHLTKWQWLLVLMILTFSVLLLNRMAWIGIGILLLGSWWHLKRNVVKFKVSYFIFLLPLLALLLLVDDWYTLWHHAEMTFTTSSGTTFDRLMLLKRSMAVFISAPLFGIGFGAWKLAMLAYSQEGMLTEAAGLFYKRPHNDYLWLLAEGGIFIGLPYLLMHFFALRAAWQQYFNSKTLPALGLLLAWLLFILASATNYPFASPPFLLIQGCLLAMIWPADKVEASLQPLMKVLPSISMRWLPFLLSLFLAVTSAVQLYALTQLEKGSQLLKKAAYSSAVPFFQSAEKFRDTDNAVRSIDFSLALSQYPDDARSRLQLLEQANLETPWHPHIQFEQAKACLQLGDDEAANKYLSNAVLRTPTYQQAWLFIANQYLKANDWRAAFNAFQGADVNSFSPLYQKLGVQLSQDSIKQMITKVSDRKMELTLQAIYNTPQWAFEIMVKSIRNKEAFDQQVYIDACYYMHKHCDTYDDCSLADEMILKYLKNGFDDLNLEDETK
jgi:O-antigen ligase